MKINEAAKITGLTKKAIYFYIEEGLINPVKLDNNYHDFSNRDISHLMLISKMRKLGLSINDIREMHTYPNLTNFILHRRISEAKNEIETLTNQLVNIQYLIEQLPPLATPVDLVNKNLANQTTAPNFVNSLFPANDSRMVAILFWGSFLNIEASEYHKYLWKRLSTELSQLVSTNVSKMSQLIYSLSANDINKMCEIKYAFDIQIINMSEEEIKSLVLKQIKAMIDNPEEQKHWEALYEDVLKPLFVLYHSEANNLMQEYNPAYKAYFSKLLTACDEIATSEEYTTLINELKAKLNGCLMDERLKYELFMLTSFSKSIFMKSKINENEE